MQYYCEKCHRLTEQAYCTACGKTNVRTPDRNDYCFLIEVNARFGAMFQGILTAENIAYTAMPSGNGVRSYLALNLENLKIFVTYACFDRAKELLDGIYATLEESQSEDLKANIGRLFASRRSERKIKKALKIPENTNFTDYCAGRILHADRIINKGKINGCMKGGEYLFVYTDNELFMVNSATYEIISAQSTMRGDR